jgi:D-sedoheptulose 7-phosphate isomerase
VGTAAFLGRGGGPLAAEVDEAIVIDSEDTSRIQLLHLALEHLIVELVEDELLPGR